MAGFLKRLFNVNGRVAVGPDEIVPGVEKPSVILVNMISAEMIKDPKSCAKVKKYHRDRHENWLFEFKTDKMFARFYLSQEKRGDSFKTSKHVMGFIRQVRDPEYTEIVLESKLEKDTLERSLHEALRLKDAMLLQEAENAKQDKAMKVIEDFFTAKPESAPKPKRTPKPRYPKQLVKDPLISYKCEEDSKVKKFDSTVDF